MRRRSGCYNPKRQIAPSNSIQKAECNSLAAAASYGGNPEHKCNPSDYNLMPPAIPRPGKTLCDAAREIPKAEAEALLRDGITKGMVSVRRSNNGWPQNVWAVSDRNGHPEVFEAQLENPTQGIYHGYPMPIGDDFRNDVLSEWKRR